MERLVFYGKGGIGKSTLSSNVSVALAEALPAPAAPVVPDSISVIGDSRVIEPLSARCPALELGFPSHTDHAFFERPYLGFRGHAALIQRIHSALAVGASRVEPAG